jgi:hypothetical protein
MKKALVLLAVAFVFTSVAGADMVTESASLYGPGGWWDQHGWGDHTLYNDTTATGSLWMPAIAAYNGIAADIPAGSAIASATLTLCFNPGEAPAGFTLTATPIIEAYPIPPAGGSIAADGYDFTSGAALNAAATGTGTTDGSTVGTIDLTSIVQGWVNDPSSNLGVWLGNSAPSDLRFDLPNGTPLSTSLVIDYTPAATPEPATMSLLVLAGIGALLKRRK